MTLTRIARFALIATAATLLAGTGLAACGDDDDQGDAAAPTSETTEAEAQIVISGAWARSAPVIAEAGAVYLEMTNAGDVDDALVDVTVDPSVAGRAELHETVAAPGPTAGGPMGSDATSPGMMTMQPVDRIEVPAGETVSLEPGGYHIMLLALADPLEVGATVELTLTFEVAGDQVVRAEVRDTAP
jgi:copper(I)-binding protein